MLLRQFGKWLLKKAPLIFAVVAAGGVAATGYYAAKGGPEAEDAITEAEYEKGAPLTKVEKVKVSAKHYAPALAVGGLTIGSIAVSYIFSKKQLESLAATAAATAGFLERYRHKIKTKEGEEYDNEIVEEIKSEAMNSDQVKKWKDGQEVVWFYEPYSKQFFEGTMAKLMYCFLKINKELSIENCISINEYLHELGLKGNWRWSDVELNGYEMEQMKGYVHVEPLLVPCEPPKGHEGQTAYRIDFLDNDYFYQVSEDLGINKHRVKVPLDPDGFGMVL